jgi:hypothetical protein
MIDAQVLQISGSPSHRMLNDEIDEEAVEIDADLLSLPLA